MSLPFLYGITFLLAACSMLYELLIAQTLSFLAGSTVIRYSVTIGLYLAGMGIGSLSCKRLTGASDPRRVLFKAELALSLLGGFSVVVLHYLHSVFCFLRIEGEIFAGVVLFYSAAFMLIAGIGFLTGLELPLLIRIGNSLSARPVTNRVLAMDYFGSLAAAVAFPLLLLPRVEMSTLAFAVAIGNLAVGLAAIWSASGRRARYLSAGAVVFLSLSFALGIVFRGALLQELLKRYYYHYELVGMSRARGARALLRTPDFLEDIQRFDSAYQKIDIVHLASYGNPFTEHLIGAYSDKYRSEPQAARNYLMFLDGDFQFWTDFEEIYHEYFAHVPIIVNRAVPRSVLILGAGDGMLARELLKYPDIERITLVELDPAVISLARSHPVLRQANKGALDAPRVQVVTGDAYYYLRSTQERFDAVYIDFPDPHTYELAKLFSAEFYRMVKRHLNPGGFAVLDAPGIDLFSIADDPDALEDLPDYPLEAALTLGGALYVSDPENCWDIFYQTLRSAGFGTILPYCSNLEASNPEAWRIMGILLQNVAEVSWTTATLHEKKESLYAEKSRIAQKHIQAYIDDLQMGFIMIKPQKQELDLRYADPGVPTYVLDERRFYLAFTLPFPQGEPDARLVNSITRPRLPKGSFWRIKTAL